MTFWREAASLMLIARMPSKDAAGSKSADYRVLVMQRSATSKFLPSLIVFPGGNLDAADYSHDWVQIFSRVVGQFSQDGAVRVFNDLLRRFNGLRPPMLSPDRDWPHSVPVDVAFRICAVRETFEECGILLATDRPPSSQVSAATLPHLATTELREWQQRVVREGSGTFLEMCRKLGVVPNIWAMREWANWLTPPMKKVSAPSKKPKRFDTMMYLCCVDAEEFPAIAIDQHEAAEAQWRSPDELLRVDRRHIITPQIYELSRLSRINRFDELAAFARDREPQGVERYMSVYQLCSDGFVIALPGDYLYRDPDYNGTRDRPPPLPQTVSELCDPSRALNRIVKLYDGPKDEKLLCNTSTPGHLVPASDVTDPMKNKL